MKLGICIPMYKQIPSDFVISLQYLQSYMYEVIQGCNFANYFTEFEFFYIDGCFVDKARNMLANKAIENNCDYILWIDSDHIFIPIEVEKFVERYMKSGYDVVCAWYNNRTVKGQPVAFNFNNDCDIPLMTNLPLHEVKKHKGYWDVDCTGFGMCITPINIIKEMKDSFHFAFRCKDYDGNIVGEDTYFFFNLKKLNKYKVALDCDFKVGHIGGII